MPTNDPALGSRRQFIKFAAGAATTIPLINLAACSESPPASAPTKPAEPAPPTTQAPKPASPPAPAAAPQPAVEPAPTTPPAELPRLAESDPTAVALGYHHDATKVDSTKYPRRAGAEGAKQYCYNCSLFLAKGQEEWAGCSIFPGKAVARNGWCNGWVPKA